MRRWGPPLVVAGFVMAGYLKGTPLLAWLPIDLTLLLAVVTVGLVVVRVVATNWIPRELATVAVGFGLLAVPMIWTTVSPYESTKTRNLFTLTLLSMLAPVVLVRDREDAWRWVTAWAAVSGVVVAYTYFKPLPTGTYFGAAIAVEGANTIAVGRSAGVLIVVAVLAVLWRRWPWWLSALLAGVGALVLLRSGSRGPLFGVVLALAVTLLASKQRPRVFRTGLLVAFGAVTLLVAYRAAPYYARQQIRDSLHGQVSGDTLTRVDLWHTAWHSTSTFGLGWGGFERVAPVGYFYPHNLALEVLAEAGFVVGGLFFAWLVVLLVRSWRQTTDAVGSVVFTLAVFTLLNALVSGDLNDNRLMFFALGISVALRRSPGDDDAHAVATVTASAGVVAVQRRTAATTATAVVRPRASAATRGKD